MKFSKLCAVASFAILLSPAALAATPTATTASVKEIPNGEEVTLTGTVEDFDSRHPFTLRDSSGSVQIDLSEANPIVLKNGQKVTITGLVDKGLFATSITATGVKIETTVGEQIGSAIDSLTGEKPADNARAVNVQSLPASGLVKLNGVVDSVSSAKKFTLRDSTGHVDVTITSDQVAALRKGTGVTVVGYVDKGLLSKSINATQVDITSDNSAVAE